jgi:nucleotide-binding universal stress UspA family protein
MVTLSNRNRFDCRNMNRSDILVPLNLENDSLEGLKFAAQVAGEMSLHTTLLHVVELNIFPLDRRVYDELCFEYRQKLQKLANRFPESTPRLCVRIGKPHEEIVVEARDSGVELIVMDASRTHRRHWPFRSNTVGRVVRNAPCRTLVMPEPARITPVRSRLPEFLFTRRQRELVLQ